MRPSRAVGIIGLAFISLFGYHRIQGWHQQQGRAIEAQISQEQAAQRILTELSSLQQRVARYRQRLPEEAEASWLVKAIVALAQEAGVQLTKIAPETPHANRQFTRLAVNVEFTASFHQLGTFLDRLERAEPFIRIERLQVAPPQSSKEAATIRAVFSTLYIPALTLDAVPTPGNGAHTERRHDQGIKG